MTICRRSAGTAFFLLLVIHAGTCRGANVPFPRNADYPFGIMPRGRSFSDAWASYTGWENTYVTASGAGGFRRVLFDDLSSTVSEGIGYGMLLSVNYNDRELFDDLWSYCRLHLDANGLMNWKIDSQGNVTGSNAATDADEDIAFSLILADRQWGSEGETDYHRDAIDMIGRIFQHEVETGTYVLKPGDVWGGTSVTNPSYFAPAYYRIFKTVSGNTRWEDVITACYEILNGSADPSTGLVPEWCTGTGAPAAGMDYYYGYNACRTPWRVGLDYLWFGTSEARDFCLKTTGFAGSIGTYNIVDGYDLDGTVRGQYHNNAFVGTFAAGAMATGPQYQNYCDQSYADNVSTMGNSYYNMSLRTLTLFLQTGNFFNPAGFQPPNHVSSGDYNGDGTSDIAVFRESSGLWAVRGVTRSYFGTAGDLPVPADYNGDGTGEIGVFRSSSGLWALRGNSRIYFGSPSDLPVPGDYDGDGSCEVGIFRTSTGLWAVRGTTRGYYGTAGDIPVPGDYDGDGAAEIAIFRGSSGLWAIRNVDRLYFGLPTDTVVPGDYDGDGTREAGIFRPTTGLWAIRGLTRDYFGSATDQPVPADYNGDSIQDMGIFRETPGLWAIKSVSRTYFGGSGDIPVTR